MRHYLLYEDELPPKLLVIFSKEIADKIESIDSYNHLNETSLEQWRNYLEGLINWLSNPVIAWDYLNRYQHDSDGTTHIVDIGYDVTFIIKENKEGKNYIDILAMKFNLEEYGLELPPNLQENTLKNNQNNHNKTMNRIRLTESQLHNVIRKCINEALCEGWVSQPKEDTNEIFMDITQKFPPQSVYRIILKYGCTPYEYFSDYIRDYYDVTLKQSEEILKKLENHYSELPYFTYQQKMNK